MTNYTEPIVATGTFRYRARADWARWPVGWQVPEVVGVATDSRDRVFVFYRGEHPVSVFDRRSSGGFDVMMDDVVAGIYALLGVAYLSVPLLALT